LVVLLLCFVLVLRASPPNGSDQTAEDDEK
jgi:hypothetical protein